MKMTTTVRINREKTDKIKVGQFDQGDFLQDRDDDHCEAQQGENRHLQQFNQRVIFCTTIMKRRGKTDIFSNQM